MATCTKVFNCRTGRCDQNLNGNTPFDQYQRQKIIQNTVRVPSSIYTMNLGALSVYQRPDPIYGVNWNQMSDRKERHIQQANAPGTNPGGNSTKRTITRLRPGALSPGGAGVDIKHNSYARYLARIKGKAPLRQEAVPAYFGLPIPFNPAHPVYGGKVFKTGIIAGCNCSPDKQNLSIVYVDDVQQEVNDAMFDPASFSSKGPCLCPNVDCTQQNQYYGYSRSDTFLLQCKYKIFCGDVIPIL
jgi:hypothetical protein